MSQWSATLLSHNCESRACPNHHSHCPAALVMSIIKERRLHLKHKTVSCVQHTVPNTVLTERDKTDRSYKTEGTTAPWLNHDLAASRGARWPDGSASARE